MKKKRSDKTIDDLFPESGKVLLTGTGKQFIERIGIDAVRQVILNVMMGENIRNLTEPLSRRRIAQISGALVMLFARGASEIGEFNKDISSIAAKQLIASRRNDNANVWPAQWLIGLTGKSIQNVLRNSLKKDQQIFSDYLLNFEKAIKESAAQCKKQYGDINISFGLIENKGGKRAELDWEGITRLTTAIGSQTLTIRGSDKSMYGKLFERLMLGSFLAIMGFERVDPKTNKKTENVFWLSDGSDNRESDATLLLRPGKIARFDIGFIGPGNSEISKDKLSRYGADYDKAGGKNRSTTFIVVDRLPDTSKTKAAARKIGAEIVQMSMQYWPRDLAQRLGTRLGLKNALQSMPDDRIKTFLGEELKKINVQEFLNNISVDQIGGEAPS